MKIISISFLTICIICLASFSENTRTNQKGTSGYYVAAYVWPSCQDESMSREYLWSEGTGEWEIIKRGTPRFEGHYQPRIPLWGYVLDDNPEVAEMKIETATAHGVNVFIYDWYWYDGKPFLEEALNDGFLKAKNNHKMKFYIMWANHDVPGNMWNHFRYPTDSLIWHGTIDMDNFKKIVERVIRQYFMLPNYFKINGEPVFSIFSAGNLLASFGKLENTREALDYFRNEVKKAGFPGLHLQLIGWGRNGFPNAGFGRFAEGKSINEIVEYLGINSYTTYNWTGAGIDEDYVKWGEKYMKLQERWDSLLKIPYFPVVSVGWDNTPRYPSYGKERVVHLNNTPESFKAFLIRAKEYADSHKEQPKLIIINAWNEWVEGSYLEPDMRWGFSYLNAVREVISGKFDRFSLINYKN